MFSQTSATGLTPGSSPWRPLCAESTRDENGTGTINENNATLASLCNLTPSCISVTTHGSLDTDSGIFITWEDLWVSAFDSKGKHMPILSGLEGFARPGEVLAVMGPSGCGKSTLLDALAGRLASNVKQTGQILINGREQKLAFGTLAYVTQDDVLMTTLTVKEAVCYSAQLQLPETMSWSEKRDCALKMIQEMGLEGVMDTRIGGRSSKGTSRGQKRRISICMEILTRPKLLFLDEPTSGLDSAAAFHIMSRIISLSKKEGMTVVVAIHQPSSEVFKLFHGLCLLAYGKTVYFGQANQAIMFFGSNGFACPPMSNPSDFFLRIINKDFHKDKQDQECIYDIEAQPTYTIGEIEVLVNSYESSDLSRKVSDNIKRQCTMGGALMKQLDRPSFYSQCSVLTKRSIVNMSRDSGYCCIIRHNIPQGRISLLVYVSTFLTFMSIGAFPSLIEDMKVFARERLNGHYGVLAFVIANMLSAVPFLLLFALIPGAVAYFLAGLRPDIDSFAYFVPVLFSCLVLVESLMMNVATLVPDFLMGIVTGAGILGVMVLTNGFFQLPNFLLKIFWKYSVYYISFDRYTNEGLFKNEFLGANFLSSFASGAPIIRGDQILKEIYQIDLGSSKWVDLAVLFGMFVVYRMMFLLIIKVKDVAKTLIK